MELFEQVVIVLLVFGLLGGLLWALKSRGMAALRLPVRRGGNARKVEVLERVPLTPNHALHLVRVSDKLLLIGTAPSACTVLDAPVVKEFASTLAESLVRNTK